jgi:hypothetical protein
VCCATSYDSGVCFFALVAAAAAAAGLFSDCPACSVDGAYRLLGFPAATSSWGHNVDLCCSAEGRGDAAGDCACVLQAAAS